MKRLMGSKEHTMNETAVERLNRVRQEHGANPNYHAVPCRRCGSPVLVPLECKSTRCNDCLDKAIHRHKVNKARRHP